MKNKEISEIKEILWKEINKIYKNSYGLEEISESIKQVKKEFDIKYPNLNS